MRCTASSLRPTSVGEGRHSTVSRQSEDANKCTVSNMRVLWDPSRYTVLQHTAIQQQLLLSCTTLYCCSSSIRKMGQPTSPRWLTAVGFPAARNPPLAMFCIAHPVFRSGILLYPLRVYHSLVACHPITPREAQSHDSRRGWVDITRYTSLELEIY